MTVDLCLHESATLLEWARDELKSKAWTLGQGFCSQLLHFQRPSCTHRATSRMEAPTKHSMPSRPQGIPNSWSAVLNLLSFLAATHQESTFLSSRTRPAEGSTTIRHRRLPAQPWKKNRPADRVWKLHSSVATNKQQSNRLCGQDRQ